MRAIGRIEEFRGVHAEIGNSYTNIEDFQYLLIGTSDDPGRACCPGMPFLHLEIKLPVILYQEAKSVGEQDFVAEIVHHALQGNRHRMVHFGRLMGVLPAIRDYPTLLKIASIAGGNSQIHLPGK
jgi:hypothetical protein